MPCNQRQFDTNLAYLQLLIYYMQYPQTRMRRLRSDVWIRKLVQQTSLSVHDFIYPVFVHYDPNHRQPIAALPGIERMGNTVLLRHLQPLVRQGLLAIAIFPVIDANKKSADAAEAWNPNGLVQQAVVSVKKHFPQLGVITDVALDPYTSHGQDGLMDAHGYIVNDSSCDVLVKQALSHADAGADIVAPSDMMDGRIGLIRTALEEHAYPLVKILAYSAKYASAYYGPFRAAVGSVQSLAGANKSTYQMDIANSAEALKEIQLDIDEGADIVMVKPALPYLDIIQSAHNIFKTTPVFAYQVSGEYAQLQAAIANGWLDDAAIVEACMAIKRAGASAMLSYFTPKIFSLLA